MVWRGGGSALLAFLIELLFVFKCFHCMLRALGVLGGSYTRNPKPAKRKENTLNRKYGSESSEGVVCFETLVAELGEQESLGITVHRGVQGLESSPKLKTLNPKFRVLWFRVARIGHGTLEPI